MVFATLVLVGELPLYLADYIPKLPSNEKTVVWGCFSFNTFNAVGVVFFAFTNQAQLLPIYSELVNPDKRRIMKVIFRCILSVILFYLLA